MTSEHLDLQAKHSTCSAANGSKQKAVLQCDASKWEQAEGCLAM